MRHLNSTKQERIGLTSVSVFGVNESGPEFGNKNLPGTLNKDYVWPTLSTVDVRCLGSTNVPEGNLY